MKRLLFYLLPAVFTAAACSKSKTDITSGNKPTYTNMAASTVRLVGGTNYDVVVNADTLTNWLPTLREPPGNTPNAPVIPTPYFPGKGKMSGEWFVPQQFLDGKGQAIIKLFSVQEGAAGTILEDSFQVKEDYNHPSDYYLISQTGSAGVTAIPRAVTPASDPTHIRIRLINLSLAAAGGASPGSPLSLALADGSLVSPVTSGVADGTWSDYVELPNGAYQFRVLVDGTPLQIPGVPPLLTSTISLTDYVIKGGQCYVPTKTFQPGGVYSVIVSFNGNYQYEETPLSFNSLWFVTDISPQANSTYARVQGINAAEKNGLHLQIDGVDSAIGYSAASGYLTLVAGEHAVKITDGAGKVLAQTTIPVKGGDNLSLWVYPTPGGADSIVTVQNNMGGLQQEGAGDGSDATGLVFDPLSFKAIVQTRFLNLCPDLPYVTFTGPSGTLLREDVFSSALAARNLQPGKPADPITIPYPYIDLGLGADATIEAYQSQPNVLPGNPLTGVADLTAADFIRMPAFFYPSGGAGMEPGVYTVALVGRSRAGEQPKMIVIKHNL